MKLCIDSNIFISIRNQESDHEYCKKIINVIEAKQHEGILSTVVISEILVGFYKIGEVQEMELFLNRCKVNFSIIPLTLPPAREAAEIRAFQRIKLPDAIIIATAQLEQADYVISNDIPMWKKSPVPIITPEAFCTQFLSNQELSKK